VRRALLLVIAACSDKPRPVAKSEPPRPPTQSLTDRTPPMRVDDTPRPTTAPSTGSPRGAHAIQVTLRSTPSGATAAVDGTVLGPTPAYWGGDADGREHEFTFDLTGYALARYRFVPITSGVVHARLEPIVEETDAGVSVETAVPGAGAVLVNPPPAAVASDAAVALPPPIVPPDAMAPPDAAVAPPLGPTP
jgi:hypothetical protein